MIKLLKTIVVVCLIFVLIASLNSCASINKSSAEVSNKISVKYNKYSYEFYGTFDTVVQLAGYTTSQKEFDKYSQYLSGRFNELHRLFDNYNTYEGINNIKTINDNAGIDSIKVDKTIIALVQYSIKANKNISPKTDISIGPILKIWHDYREEGIKDPFNAKLPSQGELESANEYVGLNNITINESKSTIFLKEGSSLDLGAVAKGYATELVADELIKMGLKSFYITSGGNVKAVGEQLSEGRSTWNIGLQNPFYYEDSKNNDNLIDLAYINDLAIVTSGDYQRFYTVDEKRYHHLIDPITLYPANYFRSVTIFTKDSALADYLSTALFLLPYEEGLSLISSLDDTDAYWIFKDGTVKYTDGIKDSLKSYRESSN